MEKSAPIHNTSWWKDTSVLKHDAQILSILYQRRMRLWRCMRWRLYFLSFVGGPGADPLREQASESGLKFVLENSPTPRKHLVETMPGGLAVFDYNSDGRPDIFFTNGAALPSMEKNDAKFHNRLFRNDGN